MSGQADKQTLRAQFRSARRAWRGAERAQAESAICGYIMGHPSIQRARWIACYLAFDGEVDLAALWGGGRYTVSQANTSLGSSLGSPLDSPLDSPLGSPLNSPLNSLLDSPLGSPLRPPRDDVLSGIYERLVFPRHTPHAPLTFIRPTHWCDTSGFALPEGEVIPTSEIEVILAPGVAFDPPRGTRLGLGGGHYDRTLAQKDDLSWSVETFGVGFSFQMYPELLADPWDVPLDGVFTEVGLLKRKSVR